MNTSTPAFTFHQGSVPLLISMPHTGTHIPPEIAAGMTDAALQLPDTDWHLEQLYDFVKPLGASVLTASHSRYVIDLNRPMDDASLYPGQDTTGLCPVDTFHKEALYRAHHLPDAAAIQERCERYWVPYHAALADELQRIRNAHGIALLWDAHSICSVVPRFFEGRLPDFNLGTASGASCDAGLAQRLHLAAKASTGYSTALNGRFKGGYITRHYAQPDAGVHAVQLELSQATYMEEQFPYRFDPARADGVRPALRRFMEVMLAWAREQTGSPDMLQSIHASS